MLKSQSYWCEITSNISVNLKIKKIKKTSANIPPQQAAKLMIHVLIKRPAAGCLNTSGLNCDEHDIKFFIRFWIFTIFYLHVWGGGGGGINRVEADVKDETSRSIDAKVTSEYK